MLVIIEKIEIKLIVWGSLMLIYSSGSIMVAAVRIIVTA